MVTNQSTCRHEVCEGALFGLFVRNRQKQFFHLRMVAAENPRSDWLITSSRAKQKHKEFFVAGRF